jgi:predicted metal-dependent phosphoesterase TrpH
MRETQLHLPRDVVRADLHMHGPIGFQPYWLRMQGYSGKNLLSQIVDRAIQKEIDITAITSHYREFTHADDRFARLADEERETLPKGYNAHILGKNLMCVEKNGKKVFIVNGQTVMAEERGKKFDILVVGSNLIPNGLILKDTLNYIRDRELIAIAEHPYVESHRGIGEHELVKHKEYFDGIETFNSQAIMPSWTSKIPGLGHYFSKAGSDANIKAKALAAKLKMTSIATSDAHRIQDLGLSHIRYYGDLPTSEPLFISALKRVIRDDQLLSNHEESENPLAWIQWNTLFHISAKLGKGLDGEYIPSVRLK